MDRRCGLFLIISCKTKRRALCSPSLLYNPVDKIRKKRFGIKPFPQKGLQVPRAAPLVAAAAAKSFTECAPKRVNKKQFGGLFLKRGSPAREGVPLSKAHYWFLDKQKGERCALLLVFIYYPSASPGAGTYLFFIISSQYT